jgi:hypothetical protein
MASVCVETIIDVPAQQVWEVVADVGAYTSGYCPAAPAARIDGDVRTLPSGTGRRYASSFWRSTTPLAGWRAR